MPSPNWVATSFREALFEQYVITDLFMKSVFLSRGLLKSVILCRWPLFSGA